MPSAQAAAAASKLHFQRSLQPLPGRSSAGAGPLMHGYSMCYCPALPISRQALDTREHRFWLSPEQD